MFSGLLFSVKLCFFFARSLLFLSTNHLTFPGSLLLVDNLLFAVLSSFFFFPSLSTTLFLARS